MSISTTAPTMDPSQRLEGPGEATSQLRPVRDILSHELQVSLAELPTLKGNMQTIADRLTKSFINADFSTLPRAERHRMEEYQAILRTSRFTVESSDSLSVNARTWTDKGVIVVNLGLMRTLACSCESLGNWDTVAFVLAHEISHTLYARSSLLSPSEKASRYGSLDMENQCDRDAMLLMDVAGFNVKFADLSFLSAGASNESRDYGVLTSHPHPHVRNLELAKLRNENFWSNYSEVSSRVFTEGVLQEIQAPSRLEIVLGELSQSEPSNELHRPLHALFGSALRRFHTALSFTLSTDIPGSPILHGFAVPGAQPELSKIPHQLREQFETYKQRMTQADTTLSEAAVCARFVQAIDTASRTCFSYSDAESSLDPLFAEAVRFRDAAIQHYGRLENEHYGRLENEPAPMQGGKRAPSFGFGRNLSFDDITDLVKKLPPLRDLPTCEVAGTEVLQKIFSTSHVYVDLMKITSLYILDGLVEGRPLTAVEELTRVALQKFGCTLFSHVDSELTRCKTACPAGLEHVLAQVGSEELVLEFGAKKGWRELLRVPFGREVFTRNILRLSNCSHFPADDLETEQIRALLFGPHRNSPTPAMRSLAERCLELGKLTKPLDLLMILDYYAGEFVVRAKELAPYFDWAFKCSVPFNATATEREQIISFWKEKMLSVGLRPREFSNPTSAQDAAEILWKVAPRGYHGDLLRAISPHLETTLDLSAYVPESDKGLLVWEEVALKQSEPELGCNQIPRPGARRLHRKFSQTPAFPSNDEIPPLQHLEAAALHGVTRALAHLVQTGHFDTLDRASSFLQRASNNDLERAHDDISRSPITGFVGYTVGQAEFIMYRYLQLTGFSDLEGLSLAETTAWMRAYIPRASELRDIALTRVWKDRFAEDGHTQKEALEFLGLFQETSPRREGFARHVYERFRDEYTTLEARCAFIREVFPMASPARDALFEECLQRLLFKISSFMEHVQPHLSVRSRHFQRAKSILDGTIGSAIDAWSLGAKRAVSEWLFLGKIKPGEIHEVERQLHCNLDELPSLMKDANSREELIRKLFMGPNGLATGSDLKELQLFLDNALTRVFDSKHTSRQEEPSGLQLKMERLVRDLIKTTVCVSSPQRQEILLCKLFELAAGKKHYAPEELLARWLPAHSAAMVKALQIVASRPEVRTLLPRLYEASKECKSHAPSMRMIDAMKAVVRNHALRKEDPVIEGQLAAASIKVVYKARFHNTQRVLKVKQVSVEKDLAESQAEIEAVYTTLQPLLTELFDIHSFPRIGRRIARAIASEIDFASERHNGTLLGIGLADKGLAARLGMRVSTPWIDDNLSDDNILVEEFVAGETLSSYLEKHPDDALRLSRSNQRLYLRLLQEGIVLSDLHQGNQMLQGTSSMTLIDTGSLFTLEPAELRMFKDVILGLSSPIAPKYFLKRALESVVGEQYENNRVLIDERLDAITALTGAERPVALLALFDDIPDFYLSETLYWSILGLSKPFGLDTFHLSNLPEYWSVLRG